MAYGAQHPDRVIGLVGCLLHQASNAMSNDYTERAGECCRYVKDARSIAEKAVWLTIAENWLILARNQNEAALQTIASQIIECGKENRGEPPSINPENPSVVSGFDSGGRATLKSHPAGFAAMIELAGTRATNSILRR
jgi:hypothetical protein